MDSIYSRRRVKIPKIKWFYMKDKNAKRIFSIFIIMLIAIYTFYLLYKSINPIFDEMCKEKVREIRNNSYE